MQYQKKPYLIQQIMKKLLFICFIVLNYFVFAQNPSFADTKIDSIVYVSSDKTKIPYAQVFFEGKNYYKNTDKKGRLKLKKDEKITKITAIGYEDFISDSSTHNEYALKAKTRPEKTSLTPKNKVQIAVGKLDRNHKSYTNGYIGGYHENVYLSYKDSYPANAFIKSIAFLSSIPEGNGSKPIFLKLYKNENGKRGKIIDSAEFLVSCKPGKSYNKIDLSKSKVLFPKEGLFIGFEWINIPANFGMFQTKISKDDKKINRKVSFLEPGIGHEIVEIDTQKSLNSDISKDKKIINDEYYKIALEVIISD